jgi:hypothetical protein
VCGCARLKAKSALAHPSVRSVPWNALIDRDGGTTVCRTYCNLLLPPFQTKMIREKSKTWRERLDLWTRTLPGQRNPGGQEERGGRQTGIVRHRHGWNPGTRFACVETTIGLPAHVRQRSGVNDLDSRTVTATWRVVYSFLSSSILWIELVEASQASPVWD